MIIVKDFGKYIKIFVLTVCMCILCLYLSSLIPSYLLKNNIQKSINEINDNGSKKVVNVFNKEIIFDTYADAMMINTAYSIDSENPFYSMLFAKSNYISGVTEKIIEDKAFEKDKMPYFPMVEDLILLINGEKLVAIEYARYWHGYLILLRPLLTIFNYLEIKIISYIIHFILSIILVYKIKEKIGKKYVIPIIFGIIAVEGYLVYSCFEETIGFSIILIESIILLSDKFINKREYFFIIGMLTAFFDLLTIPVAIIIVPLILYIITSKDNFRVIMKESIKRVILAGIGYVSMWFTKWLLVDLIYDRELIKNAVDQVLYRTDILNIKFNYALESNFYFLGSPIVIYMVIIYVINIVLTIIEKVKFKKISEVIKENLFLGIIGLLPIIWYLITREHSTSHAYFTYRNLIVTCICTQIMMIKILDKNVKRNKKEAFIIFILIDLIVLILNYIV